MIFLVYFGDFSIKYTFGFVECLLCRDKFVLEVGYVGVDAARNKLFCVEPEVSSYISGETDCVSLVVDRKGAGVAKLFGISTENPDAGGMECGHPHFFCDRAYECRYSILHFLCCFVGEGDGEYLEWVDVVVLDEVGYAVCEDTGFSGSSAGDYQHWAMSVDDSVALCGVEVLKNVVVAHCVV